jgi:methionyl-tRNA formyltransferase
MKAAIVVDSMFSPYAATLASALERHVTKPVCFLFVNTNMPARIAATIRRKGLIDGISAGLRSLVRVHRATPDRYEYLRNWAETRDLLYWSSPVNRVADELNIDLIRVKDVNSEDAIEAVRRREIDVLINAGGGIFRKKIVEAPSIGILNAHMGYLPAVRGMNALEWSLLLNHPVGVTVHIIDKGIDTGDILLFKPIPVDEGDTVESLRSKSLVVSVEAMIDSIRGLTDGSINRISQSPAEGQQYYVMHQRLKRAAEIRLIASYDRIRPIVKGHIPISPER